MADHFTADVESYSVYRYARPGAVLRAAIYVNAEAAGEGDPEELRIFFYETGAVLPANEYDSDSLVGFAYEHIEDYLGYIDLLRNEAPIKVTFGLESDPPYFVLSCKDEAPGEGERSWPWQQP